MSERQQQPRIEVFLSRPAYRLGGTVVGTVRLVPPPNHPQNAPRSWVKSAHLYVAGRCRIDPRWHNTEVYSRLYGSHPNLEGKYEGEWEDIDAIAIESQVGKSKNDGATTVCFWATNVVNLIELEERTFGKWKEVNPRASAKKFLPSLQKHNSDAESTVSLDRRAEEQDPATADESLESKHVAFTFRVDLSEDLPHSVTANCCRYFYSVVVCVRTSSKEVLVVNAPFTVWTPIAGASPQSDETLATATRIRLGSLSAMAHSAGLPCHLSATELHRPRGQMSVNRHVGLGSVASRGDVQTLRVADPTGKPCCILTVMGAAPLYPGGRLLLQLDFPKGWVPCCQVSVCLQGEELAVVSDGSRHRTRSYLFDTAHEMIESGCTERISLLLLLPMDCPCTIHTDIVKISVQCRMDLTVEREDGTYSNLQLNLPCRVAHNLTAEEMDEEMDGVPTPLDELIFGDEASKLVSDDPRSPLSFRSKDIRNDLAALSLLLVDKCGLQA